MRLRHEVRGAVVVSTALLLAGCGSDGGVDPTEPERQDEGCAVGEVVSADGGCSPPGLTDCAEGFAFDDHGGCVPILPAAPCEDGTTALPGDATCRPLADCGEAPWDFVAGAPGPVILVDGTSVATAPDGSPAAPYATIGEALAAAPAGATVAVAAGEYDGALTLGDEPLTLWGRCPSMVTLSSPAALAIAIQGGSDVTVRGLAIRGVGDGIEVGSGEARLEDLWLHDLGGIGITVVSTAAASGRAVLSDVHVARVVDVGVLSLGSEVVANDVVIRDVALTPDGRFGRGWDVEAYLGAPAALTLDRAVVDRTFEHGVYVSASAADLQRVVVRDVAFNTPSDPGHGITVRANDDGARSALSLVDAVIERATQAGLFVAGSDAAVERLVVRDVVAGPAGTSGEGVVTTVNPIAGVATFDLRRALVERTQTIGVFTVGPAVLQGVWVRDVGPEPATGWFGRGFNSQAASTGASELTLRDSRVDRVRDVGVAVFNGQGTIENVAVDEVLPALGDGAFGDGIAAFSGGFPGTATVRSCSVKGASRAGVGAFAAAVAMADTRLSCNGIDLNGEDGTVPHSFVDQGGNVCGCETEEPCKVLSTSLAPPGLPAEPEL